MTIKVYFKNYKAIQRKDTRVLNLKRVTKIVSDLNSAKNYVSIGEDIVICKDSVLCLLFCDD